MIMIIELDGGPRDGHTVSQTADAPPSRWCAVPSHPLGTDQTANAMYELADIEHMTDVHDHVDALKYRYRYIEDTPAHP